MGDYLKIIVPHSKNDQFFVGSTSVIAATNERNCPLNVFRYHFKFFGLEFGNPAHDKKFLNGWFYRDGGRYRMINGKVLCHSNSTMDMRQLIRASGEFERHYTEKSFKMGGVSFMFNEAGVSLQQVKVHGRWRNPNTPLYYRDDSDEYRKNLAKKMLPPPAPSSVKFP